MIVVSIHYYNLAERFIGTDFSSVYLVTREVIPSEREKLEEIAKRWTYRFGFFGHHSHSEDDTQCHYSGRKNAVKFVQEHGTTYIHVNGPNATEIGLEIEQLPFLQFSPSKEQVVTYDLEAKVG